MPTLDCTFSVAGASATVYLSLVVEEADGSTYIVNDQVTPLREGGPAVDQAHESSAASGPR